MRQEARYGVALALMLASYVLGAGESALLQSLVDIINVGFVALLLLDPRTPTRVRVLGVGLFGVLAGTRVAGHVAGEPVLTGLSSACTGVLLLTAAMVVLVRLASPGTVTISRVMGALLGYAMVAFAFAQFYYAIDLASSEPFFAQGDRPQNSFAYFALITMTTVGFGDLSPGTDFGQRLVALQALTGQVIMVVVVARLVSMWGSDRSVAGWRPHPDPHPDPDPRPDPRPHPDPDPMP